MAFDPVIAVTELFAMGRMPGGPGNRRNFVVARVPNPTIMIIVVAPVTGDPAMLRAGCFPTNLDLGRGWRWRWSPQGNNKFEGISMSGCQGQKGNAHDAQRPKPLLAGQE